MEEKYVQFDRLMAKCKEDGVHALIVHHPEVLGDDYDELVRNLSKVAAAGLELHIVEPSARYPG